MTSREIRSRFLTFFKDRGHRIVPSAPLVVKDDPTLLFVNAGMNPFKEYFLGVSNPKYPRVADTQKCLRVSGKHNDLEEVGRDTYHHTLFEMLGNWSFGDYFKEETIGWAWEFLTEVCGIDRDRLYVTIFEGSSDADALERDQEAYDFWKAILPEDRILMGSKKDNFWEMGDQGPCGPCSEIHVDIRPEEERRKTPGSELVNQDHPEVVEIWNLVFIQYNRKADGSLEPLPEKHIDTGMGFERLCMVLQGVRSNYDTDLFTPLIREIGKITGKDYGQSEEDDIAIRVIADHIRAVSFTIADGQLPGNSGAGYVIRRILRRAIRYGFTFLGAREPFMFRLVGTLVAEMGEAFPELAEQRRLVENVVREEEVSFLKTLEQGLARLDAVIAETRGKTVDGGRAFELYDTFGFPIDLTSLILRERGYELDRQGFDAAMKEQKDRSRAASESAAEDWVKVHPGTGSVFVGYDHLESQVKLRKYRQVTSSKAGTRYQIVLDQTPFYPEGGGQVGDTGYLEGPDGARTPVLDTRKENNEILHITEALPEDPGAKFLAVVDAERRKQTRRNHTATHLLHQALREVLGSHVEQKGSAVQPGYLRFDFSHFSKLKDEELRRVEDFVNERIADGLDVEIKQGVPMQEALEAGAMALFGEKYGDTVRTVRFGDSIELCGGTHADNTAEIWHFKILSESAVAAGVRRIEAITSDAVREYFADKERVLEAIRTRLKNAQDPLQAVESLQEENAGLKKELERLKREQAGNLKGDLKSALDKRDGVHFLARQVDLDASSMKDLAFQLGGEVEDLFLLLGSEQDGKALLTLYISKGLAAEKDLNAGAIIRELGKHIQGGGGGQPFFATAGGKNPSGIGKALEAAASYLQ
ncbi:MULTISPECIES: alanine--tRNA ligase [unclassified Robiginitalea]|uniref:alanine--tRNA ligase n=1 Tax=Robiginitalea TaxID=252306 RepID=UPI00234A6275|nr:MULTISPECIES: alanine--tRNA ligase [unclassified Robiginitalea]MDC6355639.1 alanine--tRNA ligase [Robiginitalea sp. PM2]MDC6376050.1 alanine--tRNA ligase [Robiginitalea sp. SP8]